MPFPKQAITSELQSQRAKEYWRRVRAGELPPPRREGMQKGGGSGQICGMSKSGVLHLYDKAGRKLGCGKPINPDDQLDLHSLDDNHENWDSANKVYLHSGCHSSYNMAMRNTELNKTEAGRERQRNRILKALPNKKRDSKGRFA